MAPRRAENGYELLPEGGSRSAGGSGAGSASVIGTSPIEMVAAPAPAPAPVSERVALLSGVPSRTEGGAGTLGLELERVSSSSAVGKRVKSSASEDDDDDEEDDSEDDSGSLFPPQPVPGVHLATVAQKRALWWRSVVITGMFILTWYIFATLLSMYNKWMFSPEYYGFSYPLFVTSCHMVVQFICAAFIRYVFASRFRPAERPTRGQYVTRIFPTAVTTGGDIGLSNLSLKTITLSLYTMCKSSALIFVLIFAFLFRLEQFSVRLICVICLISFGVFMMVFNSAETSIPGIIMVISASAIGGLRWALTELIMHKKSMGLSNPFATIFWLTPLMGIVLFFLSAIIEDWHGMFFSVYFSTPLHSLKTIGTIALPGVLAFSMVTAEFFIIQRAGVVPLSIAGIAKEVSTISFSAWVFGDKLTLLNMIGVVVTISGIALYSFHKYRKSIRREVHLDAAENVVDDDDERAPLAGRHSHSHASHTHSRTRSNASSRSGRSGRSARAPAPEPADSPNTSGVPLQNLDGNGGETHEERVTRLRDEFEGWDNVDADADVEYDDDESEADDDEVARAREARHGHRSGLRNRWKRFWAASM